MLTRRRCYTAAPFDRQALIRRRAAWLERNGYIANPAWLSEEPAETGDPVTCATRDLADIRAASILIAFTEGDDSDIPADALQRGGRMVELGYAIARGKRVIVVGPRENPYCHLPEVEHYKTWQAAQVALRGIPARTSVRPAPLTGATGRLAVSGLSGMTTRSKRSANRLRTAPTGADQEQAPVAL